MRNYIFIFFITSMASLWTCEKTDPADTHLPSSPACSNLELAEIFGSLTLAEQFAAQVESQNPRLAAVVLHKRTVSASYREARRARMLQTTPPVASEQEPKRLRDESDENIGTVHDVKRAKTAH